MVDVGGGDVVGGIDDDGRTVGEVDGVTEGVTEVDAVGDGAKRKNISGRSSMGKRELIAALRKA